MKITYNINGKKITETFYPHTPPHNYSYKPQKTFKSNNVGKKIAEGTGSYSTFFLNGEEYLLEISGDDDYGYEFTISEYKPEEIENQYYDKALAKYEKENAICKEKVKQWKVKKKEWDEQQEKLKEKAELATLARLKKKYDKIEKIPIIK